LIKGFAEGGRLLSAAETETGGGDVETVLGQIGLGGIALGLRWGGGMKESHRG
jgi:hypothetical protein